MSEQPKVCECCPNEHSKEQPLRLFMTMWMCPDCITKNKQLTEESEANSVSRVEAERDRGNSVIELNKILKQTAAVDSTIQVKTDLFNAETVALIDITKAIQLDDAITSKETAIFDTLLKRY